MFQNLTLGQYYPANSFIHKLDPRTKFLTLVPIIVIITIVKNIFPLIAVFASLLLLIWMTKVPLSMYFRQVKIFLYVVIITFLFHIFLTEGNVLFSIPFVGWNITSEGLYLGAFFGSRLLLMVLFSLILMLTTMPTDLTDGIQKLFRPLKKIGFQTDKFALMLGITIRFIPILFEEAERIKKAQISRGATFEGGWYSKLQSLASIIIPLFISVFKRADALALALDARGYPGKHERTYFNDSAFRTPDLIAFVFVGFVAGGVIILG
ncbi:energy-coupling factor transporter transmembrane component T family protein [candidate division KSB1 bacterium]